MSMNEEHKNDVRTTFGLETFSSAVMPFLKKVLGKKGFVTADIMSFWSQIVGDEIAEYAFPLRIDFKKNERNNGTLVIAVASGAFALDIKHREKSVLDRVNSYFGYAAVSGLRVIQDSSFSERMLNKINQPPEKKKLVSKEEQNYITELTDDISSSGLRESLIRLGMNVFNKNQE